MRATVALSVCVSLVLQQVIVTVDPKRAQTERERQRSLFWSGNCKNISLWQTENRNACEVTFKYVHVTVVLQYVDIYVNVTRFERVKTESDQGAHSDISRHIKTQGVLV